MTASRIGEDSRGVFVIAATPFADDGHLDLASTDRMVDFYLASGADGLTILGVMGEAHKLSVDEARQFTLRVLARVAGRKPVIVGVSAPGLNSIASLSEFAMAAGAAGVMIAPVAGLQGDEAVERYLSLAIDAAGRETPVCLQDFPPVNGVHIPVHTVIALTARHSNLVMFKHEDHPGLNKLSRLRAEEARSGGRRLSVLVGNGGLFLPHEIERGADGAMTGFAFPEMLAEVCRRLQAGERSAAYDIFDAYLPLVRYEQQPGQGLAIRKEILRRRGAIASALVRPPGPALSQHDRQEIDWLISRLPDKARAILASQHGLG
jgi:4-hydroxy-tetrahydrodipicolinate synthase